MRVAIVASIEPDVKPLGVRGAIDTILESIHDLGYDGVELHIRDPDKIDVRRVKEIVDVFGLVVPAIGTGFTYTVYGLSFSSNDSKVRSEAVRRVEEYLKVGSELEADVIIGLVQGVADNRAAGIKNLKDSLERCIKPAEDLGVNILLEPLNRYETNLINTVKDAVTLRNEIGSDKLWVMADTFHMNIEEKSIYKSIVEADGFLKHIHFADSNRLAPGQGHINFREVLKALKEINYNSFITAEILPLPGEWDAAKMAIQYLKGEMTGFP